MNKVLIVYHIDLDGSTSGLLLNLAFPHATMLRVNYNWEDELKNRQLISEHDCIIIADMSVKPSFARLLNKLREQGKTILLYDHHDSAISKFKESNCLYDWMILDTNRCGALICYDELLKAFSNSNIREYRYLSELTDDYDRWVHNDYKSTQLQFLWNALGDEKFRERFTKNPKVEFTQEEVELIRQSEVKLEESFSRAVNSALGDKPFVTPEGLKYNVFTDVPYLASLTGLKLFDAYPELDFIAMDSGYGSISLRSRDGIVVNHIAEALGGGGHPSACGFPKTGMMNIPKSIEMKVPVMYF